MKQHIARLAIPATIFGALALPMVAQADTFRHHNNVNVRLQEQHQRIVAGKRNGQLTWREAAQLQHRDNHIRRQENRFRHSGGRLTVAEQLRLQHELNRNSRAIHANRHDCQHR